VRWFLEHGADPNLPSLPSPDMPWSYDVTPFATAALNATPTVLDILISFGAELDSKALYNAISCGSNNGGGIPIMKYLIDHGIDVNARSRRGSTPLNCAVRRGDKERVRLLLNSGADRTVVSSGMTAAEFALRIGEHEIYEMLSE